MTWQPVSVWESLILELVLICQVRPELSSCDQMNSLFLSTCSSKVKKWKRLVASRSQQVLNGLQKLGAVPEWIKSNLVWTVSSWPLIFLWFLRCKTSLYFYLLGFSALKLTSSPCCRVAAVPLLVQAVFSLLSCERYWRPSARGMSQNKMAQKEVIWKEVIKHV